MDDLNAWGGWIGTDKFDIILGHLDSCKVQMLAAGCFWRGQPAASLC
jgi:hypothetical protein